MKTAEEILKTNYANDKWEPNFAGILKVMEEYAQQFQQDKPTTWEYFERVEIKSEADLPKEIGYYFVELIDSCGSSVGVDIIRYEIEFDKNLWLSNVIWYLRPISQPTELRELQKLMEDIQEWSDSVFGEWQRNPAIIYHLKEEVDELIAVFENGVVTQAEKDELKMEFADCLMLLVDSASHAFLTANELLIATRKKLEINKLRKWNKPDENGVIEHIKANVCTTKDLTDSERKR